MGLLVRNMHISLEEKVAVQAFFTAYDALRLEKGKFSLTSGWSGANREDVTLKEIILHAMKQPTDLNGEGGNSTAEVLFKTYNLFVERNHEHSSAAAPQVSDTDPKKLFYDAWVEIRKSEKDALSNYYLLRNERKDNEAKACFSSWRHSQVDDLDTKGTPEVKRSLISLVKASRTGYFTRFFAFFRCPTFFSGGRTHLIFNTQRTSYKNANEIKIFGIDTRKEKSTEAAVKKIIASTCPRNR